MANKSRQLFIDYQNPRIVQREIKQIRSPYAATKAIIYDEKECDRPDVVSRK